MTTLNEDLIYEILSAVEEIPAGKVASYGQIALLIGKDRCLSYNWDKLEETQ